jgi:hypothetical protein
MFYSLMLLYYYISIKFVLPQDLPFNFANKYGVIKKSLCIWWLQYRKLQVMLKLSPAGLQTAWQPTARAKGDTRLTLTPSVIPNSNYVIMVSVEAV